MFTFKRFHDCTMIYRNGKRYLVVTEREPGAERDLIEKLGAVPE
jgi:hypothetical protein